MRRGLSGRIRRALTLGVTALATLAGCSVGPDVTRVENGRPIEGRWISPEAYAAFLEGTLLEARGDARNAAIAYESALAEDPRAAEIWARLAAVRCDLDPNGARSAFEHAINLDPRLSSPWFERANCALHRRDTPVAREAAFEAAARSPDDLSTSLLVARALDVSGDTRRALVWLRALVLRRPASLEAARAFRDLAARAGATGDVGRTRDRVDAIMEHAGVSEPREPDLGAVDRALLLNDLDSARSASMKTHDSSASLALSAIARGRTEMARDVATTVLAAEPENTDAHIALLAAADLSGDESAWRAALARVPEARTFVSVQASQLMQELLARRVGKDAATAWSAASFRALPKEPASAR